MTPVSDSEIQQIVQRVTRQMVRPAAPAAAKPVPAQQPKTPTVQSSEKSVAIGSDHGGFEMKSVLIDVLKESGYKVIDCGTKDKNSVDYPDFAFAVAQQVGEGRAWRGIVVDGAGIGSCMAANKVAGVRAAMCYDYATAVNSREHNDANVLTLGGGLIGMNLAKQIVNTWLATEFGGGRHQGRVDKIMQIEKKYSKAG